MVDKHMPRSLAERIEKFCNAYYSGDCLTFVNPDNGELVSANYEVRAFAVALMRGPLSVGIEVADEHAVNRDHLFGELVEAIQAHLDAVDLEEKDFAHTGGQTLAGLTEKTDQDFLALLQKVKDQSHG